MLYNNMKHLYYIHYKLFQINKCNYRINSVSSLQFTEQQGLIWLQFLFGLCCFGVAGLG